MIKARYLLLSTVILLLLGACGPSFSLAEGSVGRNAYLQGLGRAGLLRTEGVRQWQENARQARAAATVIDPPFTATFDVDGRAAAAARAYVVSLSKRRRLELRATLEGEGFLFLDLYRIRDGEVTQLFSTDRGEARFLAKRGRSYLILLQPEIYAEGTVRLQIHPSER